MASACGLCVVACNVASDDAADLLSRAPPLRPLPSRLAVASLLFLVYSRPNERAQPRPLSSCSRRSDRSLSHSLTHTRRAPPRPVPVNVLPAISPHPISHRAADARLTPHHPSRMPAATKQHVVLAHHSQLRGVALVPVGQPRPPPPAPQLPSPCRRWSPSTTSRQRVTSGV